MFVRYLVAEGHLEARPLNIRRPKRHQAEVRVFSVQEVQSLAAVVRRETERDWAIFLLLLDTGMRATEICSLRLDDVRWDRQEVTVRPTVAKNKSLRVIPLSASLGG
jgi:integrase/recombinase XerD